MGKYDKFFNSKKTLQESISPEEAVAAIAVVTSAADSSLEELDPDLLADILWGLEIFEEYSDDELLETLDKVVAIAEEGQIGALFNSAKGSLTGELVLDAYAAGVSVLVDEEELRIPKGKTTLLKKLQEALEINDKDAKEVIDEVIAAFEEIEDEDLLEDEDETGFEEDLNPNVYESPSGNFIVLIPVNSQQGGRVETQESSVSFSDDSGRLLRIDYFPISSKQTEEMDSVGHQEYLRSFLLSKYVPQTIVANLPNAQVKHTEYLEDILEGAYFVLVDMPQGSTVTKTGNNGTATKLNAYRGVLAFSYGDLLYIVSTQHSFFDKEKPNSFEQEAEDIKQNVLSFVDTIEFL